jgi:hypothetical protein
MHSGVSSKELMADLDFLLKVRSEVMLNRSLAVLKEQLSESLARKETLAINSGTYISQGLWAGEALKRSGDHLPVFFAHSTI